MRISRNPFLYPKKRRCTVRFSTLFGLGVETISFARDTYYKEARTFRLGPIEIRFKYKIKYKDEKFPEFNFTEHN